MRTRLVFWGTKKETSEKVLLAIKLNELENTVDVYAIPEVALTEDLANSLHKEWRDGTDVTFPDKTDIIVNPLSITSPILPDIYQIDREDILKRAQTEWQFIVLSAKLSQAYEEELAEIKDRVDSKQTFEDGIWNELKDFWSKVQDQVREKNLFREHASNIREKTNHLFTQLKQLRKALDREFKELSEKNKAQILEKLDSLEQKVSEGFSLQPVFEELKTIQRGFKTTKFTKEHRSAVWNRLDNLFKQVKEKKFGAGANTGKGRETSPLERIERRYNGLINAIEKMKKSIERDQKELVFQRHRVERAEGSLEAQIRAAKIQMVEARIASKEEKLADMESTKATLEGKLERLRKKDEERKEKEKVEAAKRKIKEQIASQIKTAEEARSGDDRIMKAAQLIKEAKPAVAEASSISAYTQIAADMHAVATAVEHLFNGDASKPAEEE